MHLSHRPHCPSKINSWKWPIGGINNFVFFGVDERYRPLTVKWQWLFFGVFRILSVISYWLIEKYFQKIVIIMIIIRSLSDLCFWRNVTKCYLLLFILCKIPHLTYSPFNVFNYWTLCHLLLLKRSRKFRKTILSVNIHIL